MAFLLPPIVVQTILRILIDRPVILPPSPEDPRHWLSLVSPQWEAIINSTPDFWSSFTFLPILFRNPTVQLGIFHSLVARSGPNPLCFYFIPDFQAQEILFFGKDNVSIVDDIIHPYIGRIQYLQTILYDAEIRKFLLTIPVGAFSSLEGVDIVSINTLSHPHSTSLWRSAPDSALSCHSRFSNW
ncbi:hypothetical protein CPB84DRAFT_1851650 [Gymnopilus junonius]|uniref:F-box domain-containing protein n=1 Tax=Gymnopilus junonius TaxID=109634 RepID=A0A9P5NFS5_GYMJU|nr:hypothetical protein CPB84DRAFT_1851650 [Gymnopilus junonius]